MEPNLFKEIKKKAIECLLRGQIQHEARTEIDVKNLLKIGDVTVEQIIKLINKTKGFQYTCSPHHLEKSVIVHVCKPIQDGIKWYIKFYFIEPDIIFISIHK
ncbi:hypothetical protein MHK_007311 [Candidatus Magnetomorum sp. HK-1]|nr:hypothetical protein MHK_007311 [Candidatus Magnetomorum sp. HK-1]